MVLGTVELGLKYGIHNSTGKPDEETAFAILDRAWEAGVRELDTAAGYGDSEEIIGRYMAGSGNRFRIATKYASEGDGGADGLEDTFAGSLDRLRVDHIDLLYMHRFEQCKDEGIVRIFKARKEEGLVDRTGISIYDEKEMEYIIKHCPYVDVIQFPYNLLDCNRWNRNNVMQRAKEAGKQLYVRSVFLQGLVFCDPEDERVESKGVCGHVRFVREYAKEKGMSLAQLAYAFVRSNPYIDEIILGCETEEQMKENAQLEQEYRKLQNTSFADIAVKMEDVPDEAIDPRKW